MARRTIGAEQARTRLPEILERAHHGSETIVTKRGKPYAAVVPIRRSGRQKGSVSLLSLKGSGKGLWGTDSRASLRALRDEWQ